MEKDMKRMLKEIAKLRKQLKEMPGENIFYWKESMSVLGVIQTG
jgi:hypothetical protein